MKLYFLFRFFLVHFIVYQKMCKIEKVLSLIYVFFACFSLSFSQECRQVTVCNEDTFTNRKGDKGDVGFPGKSGPIGAKGEIGSRGAKGAKGNPCFLGTFEKDIRNQLQELKLLATPASCRLSSVYGRQTLRSGEEVFCDGEWTVVQRRFDGSVSFDRVWNEYKNGFGNLSGEFWFGLDNIHLMTKGRACSVRFDLWDFAYNHVYAEYREFFVEDESTNYTLHVSGYIGTAGDSMMDPRYPLNRMEFSTKDQDNDQRNNENCAIRLGGWWYNSCSYVHLSKIWNNRVTTREGLLWHSWIRNQPIKETLMKIRCV